MKIYAAISFLLLVCSTSGLAQDTVSEPADVTPAPLPSATPAPLPSASPEKTQATPPSTQTAADAKKTGIGLAFGGDLYLAIENWTKVGTTGDSKIGVGLGGMLGVGIRVDEMKVLVGPHISSNRWSADYSTKSQSATDSVYVTMGDAGAEFKFCFDDMFIQLGTGSTTITSGMIVRGKDISYTYSGTKYTYKSVGLGATFNYLMFGINAVTYSGYAQYANRFEFALGLAL